MIIDKNGKIFGKVNLLDVIIVLIVAACLAFGAIKLFSGILGGSASGVSQAEVTYTLEVTKRNEDYFEKINEGDMVYTKESDKPCGEIVGIEVVPSRYLTENKHNLSYELTEIEDRFDGRIKIKANLKFENPDFMLEKKSVKIGSDLELLTKGATLRGYVIGIEYDEELMEGK